MIGMLRGRVEAVGENDLVLMCGSVGYEVQVPSGSAAPPTLPGAELTLHIITLVRQDAITLCGFRTPKEKEVFQHLTNIQGIGPRLALATLGALGCGGLLEAAATGDARRIQSVPGIGKKTAERIVLELHDRSKELGITEGVSPWMATVEEALMALGFRRAEIDPVLRTLTPKANSGDEELVRQALQLLGQGRGGKTS